MRWAVGALIQLFLALVSIPSPGLKMNGSDLNTDLDIKSALARSSSLGQGKAWSAC